MRPPTYRADIDGLRAIAVLSVIGYHVAPNRLVGGFIGVDIFFVISGFLITTIVIGGLETGTFSVAEFYRRRIRRIFPALIAVLLACLVAGGFGLLTDEYLQLARHTLAGVGFVSNFVLWGEAGYFNGAAEAKPLLHLWSLAIEEQFYIVWPLLLGMAWRRTWSVFAVACGVALVSFSINLAMVAEHPDGAFYSPASRVWELALGGALAWLAWHRPAAIARAREAQAAAGLLLIGAGLVLITRERAFPGGWALLPTVGAALLISAGPGAWCNRVVLSNPVAVWFGKISYPLYLWHWPLLSIPLVVQNGETLSLRVRLSMMAVAVLLAWLTWRFIETPIRARSAVRTPALVAAWLVVGGLAAAALVSGGLPDRPVNHDERRLFLDRYLKLRQSGLAELFEARCDFYDVPTGGNKGAIDPACTAVGGGRPVVLLWGDSHMQALSNGFRRHLGAQADLAMVATSGCRPSLRDDPSNGANKAACRDSNHFARAFIERQRPARVVVAQRGDHERTDWAEMARFVSAHGGELVLLGPVPQWLPSLPAQVAKDLASTRDHVRDGLDANILATNDRLREAYGDGKSLVYVSIIDRLCRADGCLARVPSDDAYDLLVMDYGHLTAAGSSFVVGSLRSQLLPAGDGGAEPPQAVTPPRRP